jgi:predicted nuclease with TOPRIM domain
MLEIRPTDLPDWYSNKVRKEVEPFRKKTQKIVESIQIILSDITSSCDRLSDVTTVSERDELTSKSIESLAKKYQDRIHEIEIPSEPLHYEKISKFSINIKNLLQYLWQIARRWIPKLSRASGQTYKTNIRELNYHTKKLHDEWNNLEGFIEKKMKKIKVYEDIFDQIEKMQSLLKEIDEKKEEMKIIDSELAQVTAERSKLEAEYDVIKKTPLISERNKIETEISFIVQNLKSVLGYFRKPFRKFQKFVGEGKYFVRPGCTENLIKYIDTPLETFFAEQDDYSNLKMVLLELKKATPRLSLKSRDEKKLEKEIEDINDGSLTPNRQKYKGLYQRYQEISEKLKEEGLLEKLEDLQNKINQIQKNISDIEQKSSRMNDTYERNLIKVRDLRNYLENAIKTTTKEEVKIVF